MRIFERVAELGSFTQTATHMGLPKARVTMAVQQLEDELGTRLLHRTTRRVELTQDGQVYLSRCQDLLADFDELQVMFRSTQQTITGRIRVDMPSAIAKDVVLPRLPELLQIHPQLEIELSSTDRKVDLVREGFDCVLRVGDVREPNLVVIPIGRYEMANCASPAYVGKFGYPEDLSELSGHRLIHYVSTFGTRDAGFEYVDQSRAGAVLFLEMPGALTVNSSEAYHAACLAGTGIIQVPRKGVLAELSSGAMVEVLPQFTAAPMSVSLVYANRRNQPHRVRMFMNWLQQVMRIALAPESDTAEA